MGSSGLRGLRGGSSGEGDGEERGGLVVRERVRKAGEMRRHWEVRRWGLRPRSIRVEGARRDIVWLCRSDGDEKRGKSKWC
jgi:hypothetical protein